MRWTLAIMVVGVATGVVLFWFAPLLGALVIIGTMGGVLVGIGPAAFESIARMLSGYSPRRRR
jgi:hypothetical protein